MSPFRPEQQAFGILTAILESSEDAIVVKDLEGNVQSWNAAAERLYGYRAAEMHGRSIAVLAPPGQEHDLRAILERVRNGEPVQSYETVRRAKDGRLIEVSVSVTPIRDANDRLVGAVTIARDLTPPKSRDAVPHDLSERVHLEERLRQSEERWRSIVESAVDGIVVIDARGRIEAFNPSATRLFGYEEREVIGRNVNLLMPSPYHEEHDGYLARYLATGAQKIIGIGREVTAQRKDGRTFPVHLSVGQMTIGGERKFTGILHDLSERVRIETELRERAALARLGEMAAVIAHEVKNPLAGVRGAIQVIGTRLPHESKDALIIKEILARIDALNELMKDLLLFARPPRPKPEPVDVAVLVGTIADLLSRDPALKDVRVSVAGASPLLQADAGLLKIVFENLIVNSAQAMKGQGLIQVVIGTLNGSCRITVTDSGPGIPPDVRGKIFTPFFTTKSRGSGLGLPTAKRLIEAHGGTIDVMCPPAGGTVVTLQFPNRA